ncbi:hypothetical protein FSARC_5026 [Fusarium sarcochroum]|uniref:Uncharacterized protein n=1 Tax=Fusarium sarcochroum TaxID=1208366 RepID=A0A8H4X9Y3_9HYPO|nr:hypothetical protein FSARC_5026 [Fusarium sarcochroum]
MKFIAFLLFLLPAVFAERPDNSHLPIVKLEADKKMTDKILFNETLPAFSERRKAKNPSTLDWTSDVCTSAPDNPFRFPFAPACHRHDFGYGNYRIQERFTQTAKQKIDKLFHNDLYHQCKKIKPSSVCKSLADMYYVAVRIMGGKHATPGKRDITLSQEYARLAAVYNKLVEEAQEKGELPRLD